VPDDGRGVAWLAYVPIPALAVVPVLLRPGDRLVRYHAWQGGTLVVLLLAVLVLVGLAARVLPAGAQGPVGLLAGLLLLGGLVQLVYGAAGAAMGRFPRLQPAWGLASALRRGH